ncbi:hypothetical protein Rleg_1573 [Rhizobium leguminosarum bv. trifolii WSM1325]|uniref:Abortive phage infection protein C-terminal domain-containing protein n=1 Tax=Rhizobium leguminosarum bv. trifolii (strain WSM1325) TaxID=395491 RepID=C6AVQ1_RHILS|nr:AIPR family protein [Rhizobium leguminosarum]ACS55862.1 hypothetical protein Rleg_1573 [Rhizobium leguminosarum bv. trifolii WSM1325]
MPVITAIEWDILEARVERTARRHNLRAPSLSFLYLVLEQFFPERDTDFPEMVVDGGNDLGVDAIEIIERDERAEIFIFQSKHRISHKSTDRTINDSEVLKVIRFVQALFDQEDWLSGNGNLQVREAVSRIWEMHRRGIICNYRLVFCTNGACLHTSAKGMLESALRNLPGVEYEEYAPRDILRDLGHSGRTQECGTLQAIGRDTLERIDGDVRGVIASVDALSYVRLIQTDDQRSVKRHLFNENLRVFLGANGGYNSNIIETAASPDSYLFWYLNNGITITCRNYSFNKAHVSPVIRIDDFQIVNGAQTSHSLMEAFRRSPEDLQKVVLLVRIYATNRDDIAERVAVATNSQARIQSRDLRANHPALKKLETAFRDKGYFFERKRNMHIDVEPERRIDALKMGQVLLAYKLREPDRAKADSDSIFGDRFASIFHEHYGIDELCRIFELYLIIEGMRDDYQLRLREAKNAGGESQFLVYGHWFVLYAASLILTRSNREVPVGDAARNLAVQALSLVARACRQTRTAHYQLFRSSKTKERIVEELDGRQMSLFDEIVAGA